MTKVPTTSCFRFSSLESCAGRTRVDWVAVKEFERNGPKSWGFLILNSNPVQGPVVQLVRPGKSSLQPTRSVKLPYSTPLGSDAATLHTSSNDASSVSQSRMQQEHQKPVGSPHIAAHGRQRRVEARKLEDHCPATRKLSEEGKLSPNRRRPIFQLIWSRL